MFIESALKPEIGNLFDEILRLHGVRHTRIVSFAYHISKFISDEGKRVFSPEFVASNFLKSHFSFFEEDVNFDLAAEYHRTRKAVLGVLHEPMIPTIDPHGTAFEFQSAKAAFELACNEFAFDAFEAVDRSASQELWFGTSFECQNNRKAVLRLRTRNNLNPSINDNVQIYENNENLADFGFAKTMGYGFWRPSRVNQKTTQSQLNETMREPVALFASLRDQLTGSASTD